MTELEQVKAILTKLYRIHPHIHVSARMTHPKLTLEQAPARIVGVYPHFILIEENSTGVQRQHTIRYASILTRQFEIAELKWKSDR